MKNLLESFAVLIVGLLSLLIVYLIVQYNMIEEKAIADIDYTKVVQTQDKKAGDEIDDDDDDLDDDDDDLDE